MRQKVLTSVLLGAIATIFTLRGGEPGIPVFGDDFNTSGLFAENWKASKGVKPEDGQVSIPHGGNIQLRRKVEGDFAVSVDIKILKPKDKSFGFCGIDLDGIKFLIRNDGKPWVVYRIPGEKRSKGYISNLENFEFNKFYKLTLTRQVLQKAAKYTYKVDGKSVASFVEPNLSKKNIIAISSYKLPCVVDNFKLYSIKDKNASPNLAVNSSFEYLQEGVPTYFDNYTRRSFNYSGKLEDFIKTWAVDSNEKHSGKYSLKMEVNSLSPKNGFLTSDTGVATGTPLVFSVYLKASEPDFPVFLEIWEMRTKWHTKKVMLSTEWKRYEFPLLKPERSVVRCGLRFEKPGTVWADDLQVEFGEKATKYQASVLDADKFSEKKAVVSRPGDINLRKFSNAPAIDGSLEDVWEKEGTKVDKFLFKGKEKPKDKTIAYLGCDDENLYIAFRCYVEDVDKIKAEKHPHDTGRIFGNDCVEVFLDSGLTRKLYYHFGLNAANSQADIGLGRNIGWNGKWESAVKINKDGKSIDYEIKIPLSELANANLSDKWGINLGRNSIQNNQASSLIYFPQVNFHKPEYFPALVWPEGVVDNFAVEAKDFKLLKNAGSNGGANAVGKIINNSGKAFNAELLVYDSKSGKLLGKTLTGLKKGENSVQAPLTVVEEKSIDAVLKVLKDGKVKCVSQIRIPLSAPLTLYSRYNYYMNEPNAIIVGTLDLPQPEKLKGVLSVGSFKKEIALSKDFAIDVPLKDVPDGKNTVKLEVFDGAKKVLEGKTGLLKRSFVKGGTQIDRQRRCLIVDGKPFLVIAPLASIWPHLNKKPEDVRKIVELYHSYGFKTLMVVANPKAIPAIKEFMKVSNELGIKVICWISTWRNREKIQLDKVIKELENPAIIAWLAIDEPELYAKSEDVKVFLDKFRKHVPYQPTFMNNTVIGIPARFADLNTDIIMLDDYLTNRENRKVSEIVDQADIMWKVGAEDRKPCFYFIVGNNMHNHYREPTYGEQIAQSYGSIIAHCSGLAYFLGMPYYPKNWEAVKQVNAELLALQDVIFSLEKTSPAIVSDSAIRFMTRKLDGKIYVIAVNIENREADAIVKLPAEFNYAPEALVKFEKKSVNVRNGGFSDKFKAFERHVYCIDIKK